MIKIQIRPNEPLDAALRRFKRQCNYAGIFRLSKKYAYYEKRSDKNRREERERIRNIQRMARKFTRTKTRTARKSKVKASQLSDGIDDADVGAPIPSATDA
jgi:small subunit ribosomal protein S21